LAKHDDSSGLDGEEAFAFPGKKTRSVSYKAVGAAGQARHGLRFSIASLDSARTLRRGYRFRFQGITMHTMKLLVRGALVAALVAAFAHGLCTSRAGQAGKFDKLSEADRKAFSERFEKEIWPLFKRGGEDGCVGCHTSKQGGAALRMTGNPAKDFRLLVGQGFLIKGDAGSMLERIKDKDPKRHMPPANRPSWTAAETKILEAFVDDLDQKNR